MPTIRQRGRKWQAQVRIKRDGVIVHQESASFDTKRQANAWGVALETRLAEVGVEEHKSRKATLAALVTAWLEFKESQGESVSRGIQHSAKALLLAPFATTPVLQIRSPEFTEWGQSLAQTLSPATVLHHFMVMRSAFVSAPALVGVRPPMEPIEDAMRALRGLRVLGKSESRERRVSDAELEAIVLHLKGKFLQVPTDTFVQLAVALPRRREELLSMLWSDYTGETITLRDTKNPTRPRTEVVPVPPAAKAIIDALPRLDERILPYKPESVSAAFQRAVRAIGLVDIRLHDLRHEGISRLFEAGLAIQEVALISGHLSWASLRRYTHIKPSDVLNKLHAGLQKTQKAHPQPA